MSNFKSCIFTNLQLASFNDLTRRQNSSMFKTDLTKVNILCISRKYSSQVEQSMNTDLRTSKSKLEIDKIQTLSYDNELEDLS
jgi:hypothetical protein